MISILKDGVYLDLSDNDLRWETVNTLFEGDALQGDYSFPFRLPLSALNMRAFGFVNIPSVPTVNAVFDCTLLIGGRSLNSKLRISAIDTFGFSVSVASGFFGLINSDKSLRDIEYNNGKTIYIPNVGWLDAYKNADWENKIAFPPHYNPDFYNGLNPAWSGVVNRQDSDNNWHLAHHITNWGVAVNLVPFVYIHYVLNCIFAENGLTVSGTWWDDADEKTALLYNSYSLDLPAYTVGWAIAVVADQVVSHSDAVTRIEFTDQGPGTDNYIPWQEGLWQFVSPIASEYEIDIHVEAELISGTGNLYIELFSQSGAAAEVSLATANTTGGNYRLHINNESYLYETDIAYVKVYSDGDAVFNIKEGAFAGYEIQVTGTPVLKNRSNNNVDIKQHLPNKTVVEFLKGIKNRGQVDINIDWEEHTVVMDWGVDKLTEQSEIDLTALADPEPKQLLGLIRGVTLAYDFGNSDKLIDGNFRGIDATKIVGEYAKFSALPVIAANQAGYFAVVKNTVTIWQVQNVAAVLTWVKYADYYYPVVIGNGEVEKTIDLSPMLMTDSATNEGASGVALMPAIKEEGNSAMYDLGQANDWSFRFVYFRGLHDNVVGGKYHFASSGNYDVNGTISGARTAKLQGLDGWYINVLEQIMIAIDNDRIFEFKVMLPFKYLIYRSVVQIANVDYLVKSISTPVGRVVKQSLMKLLKL